MLPIWLISLFTASFVIGTDDMIIAGLLPAIADDLNVTESAAGQLVTVFSASYAVGAPVMAVATGRLPRRTVLLVALGVFALINVAAAVAPTFWWLMALRICAALAAGTITPLCYSIVTDLAPASHRGRYLGVVTSGLTVSLVVGVPLGTWIGGVAGWRPTFLLVAAVSMVALVGVARSVPALAPAPQLGLRERLAPLKDRAVGLTIAGLVVSGAGGLMTYVYLAPLSAHVAQVDATRLAVLIGLFGVAGVLGTALGGAAADRLHTPWAIGLTFGGTAATAAGVLALTVSAPSPYAALAAGIAIYGLFVWSVNPPVQVRLLGLAGSSSTAVLALNVSALYAGFTIAGALGGGVLHAFGVVGLMATSVGLLTMGVLVFVWSFRKESERCALANSPAGPG